MRFRKLELDVEFATKFFVRFESGDAEIGDLDDDAHLVEVEAAASFDVVAVDDLDAGNRFEALARLVGHVDDLGDLRFGLEVHRLAGDVERGQKERTRRSGRKHVQGNSKSRMVDSVALCQKNGTLGERTGSFMDRGGADVGAGVHRRKRQFVGEVELRAMGFIDEYDHVMRMGDFNDLLEFRSPAEVGRIDEEDGFRVRVLFDRPSDRMGGDAVGDAQVVVDVGLHEDRRGARQDEAVDR